MSDETIRDRLWACQQDGLPGIPVGELLGYLRDVAAALDQMHGQGRTYRDLLLENILLSGGVALLATIDPPPDEWRGEDAQRRDQYKLAFIYAELRTGRPHMWGSDPFTVLVHRPTGGPTFDDFPEAERAVLRRATTRDSTERYPSCGAFVEALGWVAAG